MSKARARGCFGLMLLVLGGSAACRSDRPPEPSGQVSLALAGTAAGVTYRLRNARFTVTASAGGAQQVLDSETDPNATVLTAALATGMYAITLESGWALERTDTLQIVDATLTSQNPRTFQILAGSTTRLNYDFLTSGGAVTVGTGTLDIGISVTVNADGGASDGGLGGCTTTPDNCGAGFVCQAFFESPNQCVRSCDPVTQQRSDGVPACGSANPAVPTLGCYGVNGVFTCASVPSSAAGLTHGAPAFTSAGGNPFLNGCAAGYQPFFAASSTDSTVLCAAFCQPTPTFQGAGSANGVPPYSCAHRGAPAGTECRFLSFFTGTATSVTNMVGVCFNPTAFTHDHDENPATPNVPSPSCTTLSNTDVDFDGTPDYLEWGCGPLPLP